MIKISDHGTCQHKELHQQVDEKIATGKVKGDADAYDVAEECFRHEDVQSNQDNTDGSENDKVTVPAQCSTPSTLESVILGVLGSRTYLPGTVHAERIGMILRKATFLLFQERLSTRVKRFTVLRSAFVQTSLSKR